VVSRISHSLSKTASDKRPHCLSITLTNDTCLVLLHLSVFLLTYTSYICIVYMFICTCIMCIMVVLDT